MDSTVTKKSTQTSALPKSVFAVDVANHELLKLAYNAYLANGRGNHAKTLTRGEVRGGGKKPWKQKGTGRARVGSTRSPIWRSGGITFGPTGAENHSLKMSARSKRLALRQALTLAAKAGKIAQVADIKATGKTAEMATWLEAQKVTAKDQAVLVVDTKTPELVRATKNLPNVQVVQATYLNVFTILNADKLIMTKVAIKTIEKWLGA